VQRGPDQEGRAPHRPQAPGTVRARRNGGPERPDRRERPWRATGRQIQAGLDGSAPAGASAAAAVVVAARIDMTRAIAAEFTAVGHAEPEEWHDAAVLANADLWLTAGEFQRGGRGTGSGHRCLPQPRAPGGQQAGQGHERRTAPSRPPRTGSATGMNPPAGQREAIHASTQPTPVTGGPAGRPEPPIP
jgi:hypothetical protein